MKKLLSIVLTAAMLLSAICTSGVFGVSAAEDKESAAYSGETVSENEDIGGEAVYSVIGNSESVFYNADDIYDKTTEMTYDPRVGLYKLVLYDVMPEKDIRIKIVKNHSVNEDFDIQSTFFVFDVVSACDVLVTFDAETGATEVLGDGVVPFNVREVVLLGFGNEAFSWDYTSEDDLLTEVESGVWEITYDDILVAPDPYCQVYFGVNPTKDTRPAVSYGFGNANNEVVSSGVETDAAILGSRNIAFKVEENYSSVKLRLDIRNFDPVTKTGAKFTVTVIPPEKETVYTMVRKSDFNSGVPKHEIRMVYNRSTGLYECSGTYDDAASNQEFYVLKNHGKDGVYGEYGSGEAYYYDVLKRSNYVITFDPRTERVGITGDGILSKEKFSVKTIIAAGNGSGAYLNGRYWEPANGLNLLKETSKGIWEITYKNVSANDLYQFKLAINSVNSTDNPWNLCFGAQSAERCPVNREFDAVYGGREVLFKVDKDYTDVTIRLDLRNFDFRTKQGAKLTVIAERSDCIIEFVEPNVEYPMTYNTETGLYEYEKYYNAPCYNQEVYVYKNFGEKGVYGDPDSDRSYFFDVLGGGDIKITFDPKTNRVNVLGDKAQSADTFEVKTVIAAGHSKKNGGFLNGSEWNPKDTSNSLTETSKGIWEITYNNVKAYDSYLVKFGVNSLEYGKGILWGLGFGCEEEGCVINGEEIPAVLMGEICEFKVEEDNSTVRLKFDLRNFDFRTKQGAKLSITVTPPSPVADTYGVQVVNTGFYPGPDEAPMTYNEETGLYELKAENAEPQTIEFYVVKNHSASYGDPGSGNKYPYKLEIKETCDFTITFDPSTETVSVYGDGISQAVNPEIYSVIAAGNGEDTYLNGANWDPSDTSNAMREVSDGVWEITMTDIYAYDYYSVKFAVNSVDEDGNPLGDPWQYNFGVAEEKQYPADGQAIDAVYWGENCVFSVPQDGSAVTLRLDLRDFDFKTKQGAKLSITVTPPALLGDVNSDGVVDILDAVMIQKFAVEKVVFTDRQRLTADFNGDGVCDVLDATAIQKSLVF